MTAVFARRRHPPPAVASVDLPAPVGGLNATVAGPAMPASDALLLYNLVPGEHGLACRKGSAEWATGLTGASDSLVRSLLPFTGSHANGAGNRLFACTATGIWDVSASTTTPVQVYAFASALGDAGYGVATTVVTSAGHFLLYCDEANGLHVYSEASGSWAAVTMGAGATQINGVNPASLVYVTVFKGRVWFAERDTARAWYLASGAIYGAATAFELGAQFRAGGPLVGLWNWTYDGGAGLDDSLVAISGGGDVAVYQGTDPASASTFGLRGVWYGGALPAGRRVATTTGGHLRLLTRQGILQLEQLVSGAEAPTYDTAKVQPLFATAMADRATLPGWAMVMHPSDHTLLVLAPTVAGAATEQFVQSLTTRGWSRYRDLAMYCAVGWNGRLYYGDVSGRVHVHDGYVDGVTLANPNSYTPVRWSALTAYTSLGDAAAKQVVAVRATVLSESTAPQYAADARYDYSLAEVSALPAQRVDQGAWDSGVWDQANWGGGYAASVAPRGAVGVGVDVAIAIAGAATSSTIWVGTKVVYRRGGPL